MPLSIDHDAPPTADAGIGSLVQRVFQDAQTLTRDELALAKLELIRKGEHTAAGIAIMVLGGVLALISLGLLCVTVVVALAPLIHALWLRMLFMSVVYLCVGSLLVAICAVWLAKTPMTLPKTKAQAEKTLATIEDEVQHAG
jgi:hypothetical protein